jgi:hypothetical protein
MECIVSVKRPDIVLQGKRRIDNGNLLIERTNIILAIPF